MSLVDFNVAIEKLRTFAEKEIAPFAIDGDLEPSSAWVRTVWQKSETLGMPSLPLSENLGGAAYPDFCLALFLDVLSSACPGVASVYAHHYAACLSVLHAEAEQLKGLFSGGTCLKTRHTPIFCMLFSKNDSPEKLSLKEIDGHLFLSGVSSLTGNAHFADKFCVFAKDGDMEGSMTCMVLDSRQTGFAFPYLQDISGLKLNPMAEVRCRNIPVSRKDIIGIRGRGNKILEESLFSFHNFLSAMIMGAVRNVWKKTIDYVDDRYQFGIQTIHYQEIQKILKHMMQKLNDGTSAYIKVFEAPGGNRDVSPEDTRQTRKLCKACACDIIMDALKIEDPATHAVAYGLEKIIRDVETLAMIDRGGRYHPLERVHRKVG
ncbi:MAG: acyl-CoA dehydrogenase family protein [Proteobacteria bacterium]|nr:acyl-CoA dehydrogenase family protein [Pseudomonadota bacterium]